MASAREGLDGSDAGNSARDEESSPREKTIVRSETKAIKREKSKEIDAEANYGKTIAEQARLSIGAADASVQAGFERFNSLADKYVAALEKIGDLQAELADERSADRETIVIKAKKKLKRTKFKEKEKSKRALYEAIERQIAPAIGALTPHLPIVASKLLPIGLDFAVADGDTPRAAMTRLLKRMFNEKDETGHGALVLIKSVADENGTHDWMLIQAHLVTMATQMPDTPIVETQH